MFSFVWNWIWEWVFGWGGLGAVVSVAAWALWYFMPEISPKFKALLLHIAVAVTLFTVASTYFFTKGYDDGTAVITKQWDAANAKAVQDAKNRDAAIAVETAKRVQQVTSEIQIQADDLQKKVDVYEEQLKASKAGVCILTDDDIRRLRGF